LGHITRGIEAWASDLGRALRERGESVLLFKGGGSAEADFERVVPCWQRRSPRTERLVPFLRRGFWRLGIGSSYGLEQTSFTIGLLRHLRRGAIDLLHVQDPHIALLVQRARRLGVVPTRCILAHGTNEPPEFLAKITYLQHLAPHHLEHARASGLWKPTWTAIPNFIDTGLYRPGHGRSIRAELEIPERGLVVLTVAAIKRDHKRIDYLLDEFAHLLGAEPGLPLWLVVAGGRDADTDDLVRRGRAMLGDRVRFLVNHPRERMPELYRAADVFAMCSLREMMPIALIEATASGLPCLIHRYPVGEWIVGPGGQAIDMSAPGSLAWALARWLCEPGLYLRVGSEAREHCLGHFSKNRVIDQILDYYHFVVGDRQPPGGRSVASPRLDGTKSAPTTADAA
jgi:glycosyltransferase involved in cell wall biosynthesis